MTEADSSRTCVSCDAPLHGAWCHACGERVRSTDDLSLRRFASDTLHTVFDTDSRLWRTLRTLVTDPGRLTRDWADGRRRRWIAPLRLFLLINILYFLSESVTRYNTFTTPLEVHLGGMPHRDVARRMVRERMANRLEDYNLFRARFDDAARTHAKSLVIVIVPFFALVVAGLELRRRRPLAVHLVFALHAIAFLLLMAAVLDPITIGIDRLSPTMVTEGRISLFYGLLFGLNLYLAFRGLSGYSAAGAGLRAAVCIAGAMVLIYLYRFFLFFTVFWTV